MPAQTAGTVRPGATTVGELRNLCNQPDRNCKNQSRLRPASNAITELQSVNMLLLSGICFSLRPEETGACRIGLGREGIRPTAIVFLSIP
jgi:hypothetical protein